MNSTAFNIGCSNNDRCIYGHSICMVEPQQTQALRGSESSSPSCVENQLCDTSITKSSTPSSKLTSSPYSASSSKLIPSPASIFAPQSLLPDPFLPDPSSPPPSSPSSKLTQSPASVTHHSSSSHSSSPSSKLKYHNSDSSLHQLQATLHHQTQLGYPMSYHIYSINTTD